MVITQLLDILLHFLYSSEHLNEVLNYCCVPHLNSLLLDICIQFGEIQIFVSLVLVHVHHAQHVPTGTLAFWVNAEVHVLSVVVITL